MRFDQIRIKLKKKSHNWLITGVAGFIGSNILEELLLLNQRVIGIDNLSTGNLRNLNLVKKVVGKKNWKRFKFIKGDISNLDLSKKVMKNIDIVLHQAARGSIPKSIKDPVSTNRDNIEGFLNVITSAKDYKIKSFVYASSSSVYGDSKALPKVENRVGKILSNYALTKKVNEDYARLFYELYGFKSIGLRYFNVFGKRQNPDGDYAAVIPKWVNNFKRNKSILINGDGKTSRDFCPVKNVVQANILSGVNNLKNNNYVFNVGTGTRTTLNKLYSTIANSFKNNKNKKIYKEFRKGDIKHSLSSIKHIKKLLGYYPTISFDEGIQQTINWFKSNLDD